MFDLLYVFYAWLRTFGALIFRFLHPSTPPTPPVEVSYQYDATIRYDEAGRPSQDRTVTWIPPPTSYGSILGNAHLCIMPSDETRMFWMITGPPRFKEMLEVGDTVQVVVHGSQGEIRGRALINRIYHTGKDDITIAIAQVNCPDARYPTNPFYDHAEFFKSSLWPGLRQVHERRSLYKASIPIVIPHKYSRRFDKPPTGPEPNGTFPSTDARLFASNGIREDLWRFTLPYSPDTAIDTPPHPIPMDMRYSPMFTSEPHVYLPIKLPPIAEQVA